MTHLVLTACTHPRLCRVVPGTGSWPPEHYWCLDCNGTWAAHRPPDTERRIGKRDRRMEGPYVGARFERAADLDKPARGPHGEIDRREAR